MSALLPTGSTRAWRKRRAILVTELLTRGKLECAAKRSPRCLGTITRLRDLVAGHVTPRSHGGTDRHLQPECRPCSDHEGGQLAHTTPPAAPRRPW